jgi:hypothetical protein
MDRCTKRRPGPWLRDLHLPARTLKWHFQCCAAVASFTAPASELTRGDLERLIEQKREEGLFLEYKPAWSNEKMTEFRRQLRLHDARWRESNGLPMGRS